MGCPSGHPTFILWRSEMTIRRRKKVPYTKLSSVPSDEDVIQLYGKREVIFKSKVWGFDLPEKDFIKGMAYLTSQ